MSGSRTPDRAIPAYPAPILYAELVAELLGIHKRSARRVLQEEPFRRYTFKRGRRLYILASDFERALRTQRGNVTQERQHPAPQNRMQATSRNRGRGRR